VGYRWRDIPSLLRTPLGRFHFLHGIYQTAWPLFCGCAHVHRRTLARHARIIAVVGSFGKSTTTRAIHAAIGRNPESCSGRNALSFVAGAVLRIRARDRHAVIEVGIDRPGQMKKYARMLRPDITVVTSIGSEHNRSLKTIEVTRSEKAEMVRLLRPSGIAVMNGDDPNVVWMRTETRARVVTFGFGESNEVRATNITVDWPNGLCFTLHAAGETRLMKTRLLGKHMAYPILAAVAVSILEGFTLDQVISALEVLPPTPGRMETIPLANGATLVRDDFKSAIETIDAALDALAEIPATRRMVLLGEVSEPLGKSGPIYRRLGERIGQKVAHAIFVGASGPSRHFTRGLRRGGLSPEQLVYAGMNISRAVDSVREKLGPGDVLLIKGRDTQRLDRVALALTGRTVRCNLTFCDAKLRCQYCPMLERS
jgi:UDP-N-acetylmuramoyl-tripeptide--D-alanyl-D-alanine ligase